jgi:hypothetical protein
MNSISFNLEKEYVKVVFEGIVRIDDIINLIDNLYNEDKLQDELKVLIDSREVRYEIKPSDLHSIFVKLIEYSKRFTKVRLSIIQERPYETAISLIMQDLLKGISNIAYRVCSTEKTAMEWLQ